MKEEKQSKEKEKIRKPLNIKRDVEVKKEEEAKKELHQNFEEIKKEIKPEISDDTLIINISEEKVKEILSTDDNEKEIKDIKEEVKEKEPLIIDPFDKPVTTSFIKMEDDDFEKFLEEEKRKHQ
jgi:hypothetical protein